MPLWKKLWLLFSVMWVVVAGINAGAILLLSEEPEKAAVPAAFGIAVPAVAYAFGWLWARLSRK